MILELSDNDLTILQEVLYYYREEHRLEGDQMDLMKRILKANGATEEQLEGLTP